MNKKHYRSVWLSDIHLGCKDCKADYLLDFLNKNTMDTLYLVGDIVDMWAMRKRFIWPDSHNQVLHRLMTISHQGTQVIYLPGNHDAPLQKYDGMTFGDVQVCRERVHTNVNGKCFLVLHGDQFDDDVCFGSIQAWIGDKGYDLLLLLNRWYNRSRAMLRLPYWSLAGYIKSHIQGANQAIERYRNACVNRARERGLDGVICGHIHHPEKSLIDGIEYLNDGDWVENCSALAEDAKGNMNLIYWTENQQQSNLFDITQRQRLKNRQAA
jgi:UDP-2,3-diacylglucosamine pyrophosphatase LpxH